MILKKVKDAIGVDICNLAAKRDFIASKFEVEKLGIINSLIFQLV